MEAQYPKKYVLYGLLIVCSWVLTLELRFHLSSLSSSTGGALDATTFLPPPAAEIEDRRQSSSCEGRYVYMVDVPERFNMLKDCVEGSPLFDDIWSWCAMTVNGGLGPKVISTGNGSVIPSTGGWYSTDQFALEVMFHHRMRRYECLTGDPSAATAVYVPYYPGLDVHPHMCGHNTSVRDGPSREFLRWLSSQPSWAALGGRDHFVVTGRTTWTFRREPGGPDEWCGNSFLLQPESRNMTALTLESDILHPRDLAVPYPSYFHPSSAAEVAAWQDLARRAPRPLLMAFAGAQRAKGTLAIREKVFDLCSEAAAAARRCGMLDCGRGLEGAIACRTPEKLVGLFASARFCLQPPGDSFTRRSAIDALVAGCVPVFFHRFSTLRLQYRWHDDRRRRIRYYVLLDLDDVVSGKVRVEEALSRYTDQQVAVMREEVIRIMPRFLYKDPTAAFQGEMEDAFDIAMDGVMERMRRIKNGERLEWEDHEPDTADSTYLVIPPFVYVLFFCFWLSLFIN